MSSMLQSTAVADTSTSTSTPYHYNCSSDGGCHNGKCNGTTFECGCDYFWSGDDCSIDSRMCQDGVIRCFNGGICVATPLDPTQVPAPQPTWHCDCYKKSGIALYTGDSCETPTFNSCERHSGGDYSFCVNGGTCTAYVTQGHGQEHVACDCSQAFVQDSSLQVLAWGDHCQVLHSQPTTTTATSTNSWPKSAIFGLCMAGALILVMTISLVHVFIHRQKTNNNNTLSAIQAAHPLEQEQQQQGDSELEQEQVLDPESTFDSKGQIGHHHVIS